METSCLSLESTPHVQAVTHSILRVSNTTASGDEQTNMGQQSMRRAANRCANQNAVSVSSRHASKQVGATRMWLQALERRSVMSVTQHGLSTLTVTKHGQCQPVCNATGNVHVA